MTTAELLAQHFGLPYDEAIAQDWSLITTDSKRVSEFIDSYDAFDDPWVKRTLMELIVSSYNEHIPELGSDPSIEKRISELAKRDWALHSETIRYWTSLDFDPDPDGWNWPVTPFMLRVWQACSSSGDA